MPLMERRLERRIETRRANVALCSAERTCVRPPKVARLPLSQFK
jgi:hypothetical protein